MHIKYLHTNIGTYDTDNCWQACMDDRSWRHNSKWMSWLVRSTDKSQSYLIVRQDASCFVNLNALMGYCFLPRQVIRWRAFAFLILCIILFLFLFGERVRIQYGHSNGESERISVCNINYYLYSTNCCGKFLKRFQFFTFYVQQFWKNFDKIYHNFMNVATVDTDFKNSKELIWTKFACISYCV